MNTTIHTTTHTPDGLSIFRSEPAPKSNNPKVAVIYSTSSSGPVDFKDDIDITTHDSIDPSRGLLPRDGGSRLCTIEWPAGNTQNFSRMHRTPTLDLGVMTAGTGIIPLADDSSGRTMGTDVCS